MSPAPSGGAPQGPVASAPTPSPTGPDGLVGRVWARIGSLVGELAKFGTVGVVSLIVDVGLFNLLLSGAHAPLHGKPLTAKAVSMCVATVVAYLGNRFWSFRHRAKPGKREVVLFFALNLVGLGIQEAALALSHYTLGLTGALADNISANVIGLGLATTFRFWSYRRFVFAEVDDPLAATYAHTL